MYSDEKIEYDADHLLDHYPGPVSNEKLLKDPSKFLRSNEPDCPLNRPIRKSMRENIEFVYFDPEAWALVEKRFGGTAIRRKKFKKYG